MTKKILTIIFSIFLFNACSIITKYYGYSYEEELPFVTISGNVLNENDENSPLDYFRIGDRRNGTYIEHKIKLLNNEVKIIKDNKEYVIPYSKSEDYDEIYLYIRAYENGINIIDGDFVLYIGRMQLDTGKIVTIPPVHFKKSIYIEKRGISDCFDSVGRFESYSATVEEYKKNGWVEE